jgi:hypothetical protein
MFSRPGQLGKKIESLLDSHSLEQTFTGNETDAKAILPEPRSVQKANSYQEEEPHVVVFNVLTTENSYGGNLAKPY